MNRFFSGDPIERTKSLEYDQSFRKYMASIYAHMGLGLLITAVVAYITASSPQMMKAIFGTPLFFVILIAPLGMAFYFGRNWAKIQYETAQALFFIFAALIGLMLSSIILIYTQESIATVFLIAASMFGIMSIYGYTTQRDLTKLGAFLFMGLIGLIISMIINLWLQSEPLMYALSFIGVLVFTGLTAFDVQRLKNVYYQIPDHTIIRKVSLFGAFVLYLDFINLFLMLLRLLGTRRT